MQTSIDTTGMNGEKRAALELAEAAREPAHTRFAGGLFMGRMDSAQLLPFAGQPAGDAAEGETFLSWLEEFLRDHVDADEVDRTGEIPDPVIAALARRGAFGIKVPPHFGGLGLSQTNYCRAAMLLGSHCGNLTALLSAHQSIGAPQPLLLFGSPAQKARYLPRVASGEISAFALTEADAGSDPARMTMRASHTPDGSAFLLNGEKLWCTNGTRAGIIVVVAKTPEREGRVQTTAFIVETRWPGVEVVRRCRFMGLRALYNGVIRFHDVRVPRENILLGEGRGLKVALTTLNTGRLTLPAACTGLSKRCLSIARHWAAGREQWGAPIGRHEAIADKLARMASDIFAMESMTLHTAAMVDRDPHADIRIEAAMAKLWATETTWRIVNDTMQIRGGRGYETAASLAARGERPEPVERLLRDCRINTIFEGSSEILRLFIAREALDPHLAHGGQVFDTRLPVGRRVAAALHAAFHYGGWYPRLWWPVLDAGGEVAHPVIKHHLREAAVASRALARALFHAMLRHGPALERRQLLLGRLVDAGTELFALSTSLAHAEAHFERNGETAAITVADHFARGSLRRVKEALTPRSAKTEDASRRLAREVLDGKLRWLEDGAVCGQTSHASATPWSLAA